MRTVRTLLLLEAVLLLHSYQCMSVSIEKSTVHRVVHCMHSYHGAPLLVRNFVLADVDLARTFLLARVHKSRSRLGKFETMTDGQEKPGCDKTNNHVT